MAWKEGQDCRHCGSAFGRGVLVKFNGEVLKNTKKKCSICKKFGCLKCMTGSPYSGSYRHISCKDGNKLNNAVEIVFPRFLS